MLKQKLPLRLAAGALFISTFSLIPGDEPGGDSMTFETLIPACGNGDNACALQLQHGGAAGGKQGGLHKPADHRLPALVCRSALILKLVHPRY